jgi:hypothetical protein
LQKISKSGCGRGLISSGVKDFTRLLWQEIAFRCVILELCMKKEHILRWFFVAAPVSGLGLKSAYPTLQLSASREDDLWKRIVRRSVILLSTIPLIRRKSQRFILALKTVRRNHDFS